MAVRRLTRRNSLKLLLAANAAWLGSLLVGPWIACWQGSQLQGSAVPIEGLGLGIRFTGFLRSSGVTTIGKLLDLLQGADAESRSLLETDTELAEMLRFPPAALQIWARLAVFQKSGPVPFATLTRLETEVRRLVLEGWTDRRISSNLGINRHMVRAQLRSIYRKMNGLCAPYAS